MVWKKENHQWVVDDLREKKIIIVPREGVEPSRGITLIGF